ncbi:MAG: hypothetical protein RLZZ383_2819 [Pseudomonadota bacterium]|jgi:ArsR family transcriptional regulator
MSDWAQPETELADLAAAIASPARVRILKLLARNGGMFVSDLVEALPLAQSTVSEHLRVLRDARVVAHARVGQQVRYEVDPGALRRLSSLVGAIALSAPAMGSRREG